MSAPQIPFDAAAEVLPESTVEDVTDAIPLHDALIAAGISSIDLTLHRAWHVIDTLVAAGGFRVGAGTVRSTTHGPGTRRG